MTAIRHETWIDAPIHVVYELLATPEGMSSWWDKQTCVQTAEGEVWRGAVFCSSSLQKRSKLRRLSSMHPRNQLQRRAA